MNKNKVILISIGGVMGLLVLVMAYLDWSSFAAKTAALEGDDESEGLEQVVGKAQQLSRKQIYPCAESVRGIASNETQLVAWKEEAIKLASRGDKFFEKTTPAAFKEFIVGDAKRLAALPGGVGGVLVKPDFAFGPFKDYISEGKMPAESKLPVLQRQWDDIATVVSTLASCGIAELVDVQFKTQAAEEPKEEQKPRKNKKQKKSAKNAAKEATDRDPTSYTYVFTFTTRAPSFVKAINALETCERFTVVDNFSFTRTKDVISEALGGEKKSDQPAAGGRRGRRRGGAAAVEQPKPEEAALKNGIVTDPLLDEPFKVELTVSTYDFRTLEGGVKPEAEKTEEEKK